MPCKESLRCLKIPAHAESTAVFRAGPAHTRHRGSSTLGILDEEMKIEHVFREYNSEADGLANEAIDAYDASIHTSGVVVNDRWF